MHSENVCTLTGFGGKETKPIVFLVYKKQVNGVKLTDDFHVISDLDGDILLGVNA